MCVADVSKKQTTPVVSIPITNSQIIILELYHEVSGSVVLEHLQWC